MILQTTSLLRSIWCHPLWKGAVLESFKNYVQQGASRNDVKSELRETIIAHLAEIDDSKVRNIDVDQVDWDQIVEFFCACYYRIRTRRSLPDVPPDDIWVQ